MKGYHGKVLYINLSTKESKDIIIDDTVYEKYLSGIGLAAYLLPKLIPVGADPLGKDNVIGVVSGLLTGTGTFMTGRWLAVGKSPLTGGWGDANCGGNFAPAIKRCGYDGIFVQGKSNTPVYILVDNKGVQIKDATDYWGLDTVVAEEKLIKDNWIKKKPSVALIGMAGEKQSLIAGITNDYGRIAARSGLGAIMGSKKLKAIVLAGTKRTTCENSEVIKHEGKLFARKIENQNVPNVIGHALPLLGDMMAKSKTVTPSDGLMVVGLLKRFGTAMNNTLALRNGDAPIKNWKGDLKDFGKYDSRKFNPLKINKTEYQKYHCYSCVIGCGGICDIKKASGGEFSHTHKPEYETVNSFGGLLLNKDHETVLYINELLNRAGMDTISAGSTIAYAIECFEEGIITEEDTGGIQLTWGNKSAITQLVKLMIAREGFGDILADGVKEAVKKIGHETSEYAIHCGGQEAPMHDPRLDPAVGVHYSADPTPGKHTIGAGLYYNSMALWDYCSWAPKVSKYPKEMDYVPSDEEALKTVAMSCYKMILDGAGGCYYAMLLGNQHWNVVDYLNYATGWTRSYDDYMKIGKRIHTTRQQFNIREGIDPINNIMGKRMRGEPTLKNGPLKGKTVEIEKMVQLHWKHFGWDEYTGVPLKRTLAELEISTTYTQEVSNG